MNLALILLPFFGGLAAWGTERWGEYWPRRMAALVLAGELVLAFAALWAGSGHAAASALVPVWSDINVDWVPRFGIHLHLAMDGLSWLLVMLTAILGLAALTASWVEIERQRGFFFCNLLWTLAGVMGIFLARDMFLFFFFWELMLVPMYFLIQIWGHDNRVSAAIKFFVFTQAGGLLMLVSILALVVLHHQATGQWSFEYDVLKHTQMQPLAAWCIFLGFFIAFAVKLPAIPLHVWLPDAHGEASTGGSIILAAILLKTGAYGLLRFCVPMNGQIAQQFAPIAMWIGVAGVLYGAVLAFAQSDIKRFIAYTSISHMGFVMLAVFAWTLTALQGSVVQVLAHGLSSGALFFLAGCLYTRMHSRDLRRMGGLWKAAPTMAAFMLFWIIASLSLPGLANFVGEFLALLGSFRVAPWPAGVAAVGIVLAAIYGLVLMQKSFFGVHQGEEYAAVQRHDLGVREVGTLAVLSALSICIGVYPQPVLNIARPALQALLGGA